MANNSISFTTAGNHWRWVGNYWQEVQVGQVVTMPATGKVTALKIKIAGLGPYTDPVYHDQQDTTKCAAAVWDFETGAVIAKSAVVELGPENGGSQTWKSFNISDVWIDAGQKIIVGFWRIKSTTQYATQWDYNDADADAQTMVVHNQQATTTSGPIPFVISETRRAVSINYELDYVSGGHVKVWDGSTWRDGVAKVWDGSVWTPGVVKVYNGTDWVETQ